MKIKLDPGAILPTKGHEYDAGYDLYAMNDGIVRAGGGCSFDTGVHFALNPFSCGLIKSRSSLNVKHNITAEGVIDSGYRGSIVVKLLNHGDSDYRVNKGDRIAQLLVVPVLDPPLMVVDELDETERGCGGFGSTGK